MDARVVMAHLGPYANYHAKWWHFHTTWHDFPGLPQLDLYVILNDPGVARGVKNLLVRQPYRDWSKRFFLAPLVRMINAVAWHDFQWILRGGGEGRSSFRSSGRMTWIYGQPWAEAHALCFDSSSMKVGECQQEDDGGRAWQVAKSLVRSL
jgi:hypothetical protein